MEGFPGGVWRRGEIDDYIQAMLLHDNRTRTSSIWRRRHVVSGEEPVTGMLPPFDLKTGHMEWWRWGSGDGATHNTREICVGSSHPHSGNSLRVPMGTSGYISTWVTHLCGYIGTWVPSGYLM